jgi:hypothetical protein
MVLNKVAISAKNPSYRIKTKIGNAQRCEQIPVLFTHRFSRIPI